MPNAQRKEEPATKPAPKRELVPAGSSTDPAVHQLMAHIQTAQMNDDQEAVDSLNEQLAELGYC